MNRLITIAAILLSSFAVMADKKMTLSNIDTGESFEVSVPDGLKISIQEYNSNWLDSIPYLVEHAKWIEPWAFEALAECYRYGKGGVEKSMFNAIMCYEEAGKSATEIAEAAYECDPTDELGLLNHLMNGLAKKRNIVSMLGGTIRLDSKKGKGSRFTVEISMQEAEEQLGYTSNTPVYHNNKFHDVVAIDNDEVLLLMLKEMYSQEGIHCDTCTDAAALMEMIRQKEYSLLLTDLNMPDINGFELLELLRSSNVGNSPTIPVVVATASGSCNKGELLAKGFAGCLFKPFSISELMEVSDKCAIKATPDGEPDFSALLSYGNEAVMLDKLMTETEKEMQAVQDAAIEKDLQKLDSLTHHLRSSWEVLRADQPLRELYGLLHGDTLPDGEALSRAVTAVLEKGAEIIRLAEKERRKYEDG